MNYGKWNRSTFVMSDLAHPTTRVSLIKLYFCRGLLALTWAVVFAKIHEDLNLLAIAVLAIYPLIDAVSSFVDYRTMASGSERQVTAFNAALSTLTAIALCAMGSLGPAAILAIFGAWAVISGAAQFALGLRRRGQELGRQWPMLIAGGLSFLVGFTYCFQATGAKPDLAVLSVYATGGGFFFVFQAALLARRLRYRRQAA